MTVITAQNGRLPASALTATRTGQRLRHNAADGYARLDAAMRRAGQGALTMSTGLSGYRTLAEQQHMRNLGLTTIAVGRSPHGEGLAADWQGLGGLNGTRYRWLRANAGPFGWFHPAWAQAGGVNPSPHHWEYDPRRDTGVGGPDTLPDPGAVAAAVWGFALRRANGPVADAGTYLVDARVLLGDPTGPLVRVAEQVWAARLDRPNGPATDAGTYLVDTRATVGPLDRGPVSVPAQVWGADVDRPGVATTDAGTYVVATAAAVAHERPALSDATIERIAVAVVALLDRTTDDH